MVLEDSLLARGRLAADTKLMPALILSRPGRLIWDLIPRPIPTAAEALVRVRRCGLADSDLRAWSGQLPSPSYPRRLGHEMCVEVISSPDKAFVPGDLCAVNPYGSCGKCYACRSGEPTHCREQNVMGVNYDGAYAHFLAINPAKLHRTKGLSPDEVAVAELFVRGAYVAESAGIGPNDRIVILGLSDVGLATALFARTVGARVAVVAPPTERFAAVCAKFHLRAGFHPSNSLAAQLHKHFGGTPTLVVNNAGDADSMREAFDLADDRASVAFAGLFPGEEVFHYPDFNHASLTNLAGRPVLGQTFSRVIQLMERGKIHVGSLITHAWRFKETADKLPEFAREIGLVKAVINFDE